MVSRVGLDGALEYEFTDLSATKTFLSQAVQGRDSARHALIDTFPPWAYARARVHPQTGAETENRVQAMTSFSDRMPWLIFNA
jgi:hypothetical protein